MDMATIPTSQKIDNGVIHMVSNLDDRFEPMRSNNFELYIPALANLKTSTGKYVSDTDFILSVKNVGSPSASVDTLEVGYSNAKAKYAGMASFDNKDIVFNDFLGIDVARVLEAWYNQVFDLKTHKIGRKSKYAKTAYLIEYTPDGQIERTWELHNCWINSFELGAYDNENSSIREVKCTFVYDWFDEAPSAGRANR
jgi:hypothetical protein